MSNSVSDQGCAIRRNDWPSLFASTWVRVRPQGVVPGHHLEGEPSPIIAAIRTFVYAGWPSRVEGGRCLWVEHHRSKADARLASTKAVVDGPAISAALDALKHTVTPCRRIESARRNRVYYHHRNFYVAGNVTADPADARIRWQRKGRSTPVCADGSTRHMVPVPTAIRAFEKPAPLGSQVYSAWTPRGNGQGLNGGRNNQNIPFELQFKSGIWEKPPVREKSPAATPS